MKQPHPITRLMKKDSNLVGILVGLLLPVIFFGILFFLNVMIVQLFDLDMFMRDATMKLLAIAINVLPIRYYFVKLKYDQSGRGVLLVTFVYVVVYFWLFF